MIGEPLETGYDPDRMKQGKEGIDKGTLGRSVKSQEDNRKVLEGLEKKLGGWDPAGGKPKSTFHGLLEKSKTDLDAVQKNMATLEARATAAEKKQKEAEEKLKEGEKNFETELVKLINGVMES